MCIGSVPMAILGAYLLHLFGFGKPAQTNIEIALGAALLIGAAAMVLRYVLDLHSGESRQAEIHTLKIKPIPTVLIGMVGGLIVGMTSVGAKRLVGTDLTQAVPLTLAAALGALVFGHIEFSVTTSIIIGSVPAVLIGSFFSSRAPDKFIRPVITFVIFASGLKYVGMSTTDLGWTL